MSAILVSNCLYCGAETHAGPYCCSGCETLANGFSATPSSQSQSSWSYLDQPNFKEQYQIKSGNYDFQLYVHGIHCSSCVHNIEKLSEYDSHIESARVDLAQSKLFLKVGSGFSLARTLELLKELGYEAKFLLATDDTSSEQLKENKMLLKRLAVAGACAGNIMLFVIPIYSGLEGSWATAFNWIGFFLFLPIVFYSGRNFYSGALSGLRARSINIDLPITVALLSSFMLSTVNLIRGDGAVYYDSTASFIFLILSSRYYLRRTQQRFLTSTQLGDLTGNDRYLRCNSSLHEVITLGEIQPGDQLRLRTQQILPTDCELLDDDVLIDVSVLNGEPMPRTYGRGMRALAGSRLLSKNANFKVLELPSQTHLAQTLKLLQEGFWRKSKFLTLTDKCAQYLIVTVFLVALGFFAFYFNTDPQEAFNRSLALIVLACPCALALGSPLALALTIKKAQDQGILIKNADSLENLLNVKNVFFDKTGTLTDFTIELADQSGSNLTDHQKALILGLESESYHPIAFALRKAWNIKAAKIENRQDIPGIGVSGYFENHFYEFGQTNQLVAGADLQLSLKKDGIVIETISLTNPIRPEAPAAVKALKDLGLQISVLSGDKSARVQSMAKSAGIDARNAHGDMLALEKMQAVAAVQNTCMIGDGTNDALSLKAADVGIALQGSSQLNIEAADICFLRPGLNSLVELFALARKTKRLLVRNLTFSLCYNLIGASLALAGFVSPWLAAILMPISSFIILTSSIAGTK